MIIADRRENMVKTSGLVVVVGSLGLALGFLGCGPKGDPAITGAGLNKDEAVNRLRVVNDLKMMVLSFQAIGDSEGTFLPADGAEFEPKHMLARPAGSVKLPAGFSWRAGLLHLLGADSAGSGRDVYVKLCQDKFPLAPGAGPTEVWNRPDLKNTPFQSFLREKPQDATEKTWDTRYRVFLGPGAAFEPGKRISTKDFPDGLDKTILIVEAGEAVPWPKPDELVYDPAKPLPKLGSTFSDGFYAAFADGSVRFIKNGTEEKLIRAWITRSGGEPVTELPPAVDAQALRKAAGLKD
jgi:hypothetical protein